MDGDRELQRASAQIATAKKKETFMMKVSQKTLGYEALQAALLLARHALL